MKRIVLAADLGDSSTNALARAIRLAARIGASIHIIHARQGSDDDPLAMRQRIRTEAQLMSEEMVGRQLDISVHISVLGPAESILRHAERFDADLIVLGGHAEPRFRDAIFGTTGTHVVRHSERPVLIVQASADLPYAKVLIAVDDPQSAKPLLATSLEVAPAAEVFAVHAFNPPLSEILTSRIDLDRQQARYGREIEGILAQTAVGGPSPRLTASEHVIVEPGDALSVLMEETEALKPDLLVMGTRRRASYLGSHAVDTLFWCLQDILVVPERESVAPAVAVSL